MQLPLKWTYYLGISILGMDYSYVIINTDTSVNLQLQLVLQEYEDLYYTGTASTTDEALNLILKVLPDLIIVNLADQPDQMFGMVAQLHQYLDRCPLLIAVSSTKNLAYNAIKSGFYDYWLLPTSEFDVRKTVFKLRKQMPKEKLPTTLCLKTYNDYHYLDTNEILYLKADNNSTDFFMRDGKRISAYKTLKTFEELLPNNFIRIHQSYILNTQYVSRINFGKSTCSLRNIDNQLPFSKSYRDRIDELKTLLSKNAIRTLN
ncbi:MAG: LytTR family DNA-binding domain-containing protein [Bacteroidota bacterium]